MQSPFEPREWHLAHQRSLILGPQGILMAIINVTPDSFSDGGRNFGIEQAVANALDAVAAGAGIIDVGGESTRPGADPVSATEEQDRVLPVIEALRTRTDALISIDTYRAETARKAVASGAHIINDVHGLQREPEIADVAAESAAGICIMHTGRGREKHPDVIEDQRQFFKVSLAIAEKAGVAPGTIVLDPGFGFNKEMPVENLELMRRFQELHEFGYPLLAGTSRKRFLGAVTGREAADRDLATAATTALLRDRGAAIFRVHDVATNRDALAVADAMIGSKTETGEGT